MIYIADTANLDEIKRLYYYFPLKGITTNPTIILNSGTTFVKAIDNILSVIGNDMIHVQVISEKAEDMLKEAKKYKAYFNLGENYYTKIPVTDEGYRAIRLAKDAGLKVTATAIFTQQQALVASRAGADYVAPYVSRLDNISSHGIEVVGDIVENIKNYNLNTQVLAASFKTVDQVYRVSKCGAHSATISFEVLEALRSHPMTEISVQKFINDSKISYSDIDF